MVRVAVLGLVALCSVALAQGNMRVRGTIAAFDGRVLSVHAATGAQVQIRVDGKTEIVFARPIALSDIKPGDFLGVTSRKGAGGALTAYDIRRLAKPVNPGHHPFDGRDDHSMTNATVEAMVQAASGRELTLTYADGVQKILVPESAAISELVPGSVGQLVAGAPVNLTVDAGGAAVRMQVGPPKRP